MSQLEAMGFPTIRCQKALLATGNNDADSAMSWLFEHMEDPGKLCRSVVQSADGKISMPLSLLRLRRRELGLDRLMTRSP